MIKKLLTTLCLAAFAALTFSQVTVPPRPDWEAAPMVVRGQTWRGGVPIQVLPVLWGEEKRKIGSIDIPMLTNVEGRVKHFYTGLGVRFYPYNSDRYAVFVAGTYTGRMETLFRFTETEYSVGGGFVVRF